MLYRTDATAKSELEARHDTIRRDVERAKEELAQLERQVEDQRAAIRGAERLAKEYQAVIDGLTPTRARVI